MAPSSDTDVAVIGAGPYGLSLSAHLSGRGVRHEIFGTPMDSWRNHMPVGMHLKSEGFASNLSDPAGELTLERFCRHSGIEYARIALPISVDTFSRYGAWFQENAVPQLDRRYVEALESAPDGFRISLADGESLRARRVVVATGIQGQAYIPPELEQLPEGACVHTYDQRDPAQPIDASAVVLGAGQSALEAAALLREGGRRVRIVARTGTISWLSKPKGSERSLRERFRYPESGLGEGRAQWLYSNHPLAFHRMPSGWRNEKAFSVLGPAGAWWLRPRVEDRIDIDLGRRLTSADAKDGKVCLVLDGPAGRQEIETDQVVAGTGYKPNLTALEFLDPELREKVATSFGAPVLSRSFETSVPGLYFIGYLAAPSFGPLMRFVFGARFTATQVASRLAAQSAPR